MSASDVLQRYAAAFADDPQRVADNFYTDGVVLRVPGRHAFAGEFRGRDAVRDALDAVAQATDGTFGAREVKHMAFTESTAMVHLIMGAARRGRSAEWERVIVYQVSGERIDEITFFDFDARVVEDLLS